MRILAFSTLALALGVTSAMAQMGTGEIDPDPDMAPKPRCERRAFEVNDFGKEGPISLAKQDMRNYVNKIKKREGVSKVRVSHKKPTCRLYLWLGPASEYTCRIEATICWTPNS